MSFDITDYYSSDENSMLFSEAQASAFAKGVAGDFNPIHDVGSKRFCVPGDLLFSALLHRFGVYSTMRVDFQSMLGPDTAVMLPAQLADNTSIADHTGRALLSVSAEGEHTTEANFIQQLSQQYVQFSGKTFPDILVQLMRDSDVMINPSRPLVIYKDMQIELNQLSGSDLTLKFSSATLEAEGKKGKACLRFEIYSADKKIGKGEKNMVLGGLRAFDDDAMNGIVEQYNEWKSAY